MSMVKTLKQIGNSYGVIIDKPILEILHITPETPLEITTDGESLQIRPVRQRKRPALNESLAAVNKRHASTLKKLAK
jgi:antitoxin MazE